MKIHKNQTLWFFFNFHDPGLAKSQKSDALILFNFHDPWYMKIRKNKTVLFSFTFMTPNPQKSDPSIVFNLIFMSFKQKKIEESDFCGFSCTRGHENWRKSRRLIFVDFPNCPGKFNKIRCFDFFQFSWPQIHENSHKSDPLNLFNFYEPGYMKIEIFASVISKMTSKLQQPQKPPIEFWFKWHFQNQWLPPIEMSYRLTYLENFHFSNLLAASEAGCWKFEKWKFSE